MAKAEQCLKQMQQCRLPGATPAPTVCCNVKTLFSKVLIEMVMGKDSFCNEAFNLIIQIAKLRNMRTYRITKADLNQEGKTLGRRRE